MIDSLTRLLLERYQPDSPLLQEAHPIEVTKLANRSCVMKCVMSSDEYPIDLIKKNCTGFNAIFPELKGFSYQLPVDFSGVCAGSWVMFEYEEDK